MASSSEGFARWRLRCDGCGAEVWIGPRAGEARRDAWCESCQGAVALAADEASGATCAACGAPLTLGSPRFVDLPGDLQNLSAVLAAWEGDAVPLALVLPDRPRFAADIEPPAPALGDPPPLVYALQRLARGRLHSAAGALEPLCARGVLDPALRPRALHALAIAESRLGDHAAAETAWSEALALGESAAARLGRGVLRAERGAYAEALEDLGRAGASREARWNRAALAIVEAVAVTPGLPARAVIEAARAEAGEPPAVWSEQTVGRLLWSALVSRALARSREARASCPDARVLRAAEGEFEHDTFWDRGMVLHGYSALAMREDAARVAAPLAIEGLARLLGEPFSRPAASEFRAALESARDEVAAGRPAGARARVRALLERDDVSRFRLRCMRCGHGGWGVESVEESGLLPR